MLLLVWGLPATAVVAGLATLAIALRSGDAALGTDPVQRMAQVQSLDLGPDRAASRQGLRAVAELAAGTVSLRLAGQGGPPQSLLLRFEHPSDGRLDRQVRLDPQGALWSARLDLPEADHWRLILQPADGAWRIEGRLQGSHGRASLGPRFGDG